MSTRGTVIVIHPDRAARAELGKALDRAGFTPVVLEDLGDAVAVAGRSKGAVVLASAHDKGTAVHAAVRALRAAPATHEIPILALLRSSSEPEIQEALEAGADDFLIEPCARRSSGPECAPSCGSTRTWRSSRPRSRTPRSCSS